MRILQLIQKKQYRGAEIFCCQLSNHLIDFGHEVEVYSIYEGDALLPFKREVKTLKRPALNRYLDLKGWKQLSNIISEFKPEIVQANAADTLKYAILSQFVFGWKTPVIFRNASSSSFYIKNGFSRRFNAFLLKRTEMILSVSQASKNDLNTIFPFTENKSFVITVGVEKSNNTISNPVFQKEKKNIIHVGSFTREKNHQELLSIFNEVKLRQTNVILHLFGDGPLKNEVEQKVQKMDLSDSVIFYGEVKNPFTFINTADVFVLPSLVEGLPAVLLEAMYGRTPVVAYNVGGIGEIISPETGYLVEKNNKIQFVEALEKALIFPDREKINNAFNMVNINFMNISIAGKFASIYKKFIADGI